MQMSTNFYLYMVGLYIAFQRASLGEASVSELVHLYGLKSSDGKVYYLSRVNRPDLYGLIRILSKLER